MRLLLRWLWLIPVLGLLGVFVYGVHLTSTRWQTYPKGYKYDPAEGYFEDFEYRDKWSGTRWKVRRYDSGLENWTPIVTTEEAWSLVDTNNHPEFAEFRRKQVKIEYEMKQLGDAVIACWKWYAEHHKTYSIDEKLLAELGIKLPKLSTGPDIVDLMQINSVENAFRRDEFYPPELPPRMPGMPAELLQGYNAYDRLYRAWKEIGRQEDALVRKLAVEQYVWQAYDRATAEVYGRLIFAALALLCAAVALYHRVGKRFS